MHSTRYSCHILMENEFSEQIFEHMLREPPTLV